VAHKERKRLDKYKEEERERERERERKRVDVQWAMAMAEANNNGMMIFLCSSAVFANRFLLRINYDSILSKKIDSLVAYLVVATITALVVQ